MMRIEYHFILLVLTGTLIVHTVDATASQSEAATSQIAKQSVQVLPGDVSGHWSGVLELRSPSGTVQTQPVYLILSQEGSALTGSAGSDERSQIAIRNGRVTRE